MKGIGSHGKASQAGHDEAHCASMTLPPYTRNRVGEKRQLSGGPKPRRMGLCVRKCSHILLSLWFVNIIGTERQRILEVEKQLKEDGYGIKAFSFR